MLKNLIKRYHNKFSNDNIDFSNDNYAIQTYGVILNSSHLLMEYNCDGLAVLIVKLYLLKGEKFAAMLRGSFCIIIHDKRNEKWLIYTNQIGDKIIYYHFNRDLFVISDNIIRLSKYIKEKNTSINQDSIGAYNLLTYGFQIGSQTLVAEIKRLLPGCYIKVDKEAKFSINKYYSIQNIPEHQIKESDLIEELDFKFHKAIELEFNKDKEYGYEHIAALSGGLDCRMTTFVAHSLGYNKVTNVTFSQSAYLDMTIAQDMIGYLKNDWIFRALDNGQCMTLIDGSYKSNRWCIHFFWIGSWV